LFINIPDTVYYITAHGIPKVEGSPALVQKQIRGAELVQHGKGICRVQSAGTVPPPVSFQSVWAFTSFSGQCNIDPILGVGRN